VKPSLSVRSAKSTRKSIVRTAFKSKVKAVGGDLGKSVSIEDAAKQLKSDFAELATTYQQSFGPIGCG
jgi:hypothetical protein